MATLTQDSTFAEIRNEYATTASYHEDNSVAKARRFVTACRLLLLRLPKSSGHGASRADMNPDMIERQLLDAERFVVGASGTNSGVKHLSFRSFRR